LPNGILTLQEQLLSIRVQFFDCDVQTLAPALLPYVMPFGGLYGMFVDYMLGRAIAFKLPTQLESSIRDKMGKFNWTIFDISDFDIKIIGDQMYAISPAVSRMDTSVLLGFDLAKRLAGG
jgi:hypothetical protein